MGRSSSERDNDSYRGPTQTLCTHYVREMVTYQIWMRVTVWKVSAILK